VRPRCAATRKENRASAGSQRIRAPGAPAFRRREPRPPRPSRREFSSLPS
jgi:hypothetical protein